MASRRTAIISVGTESGLGSGAQSCPVDGPEANSHPHSERARGRCVRSANGGRQARHSGIRSVRRGDGAELLSAVLLPSLDVAGWQQPYASQSPSRAGAACASNFTFQVSVFSELLHFQLLV